MEIDLVDKLEMWMILLECIILIIFVRHLSDLII